IGLLSDIERLDLIKPDDRILLIGAGGAARGVIRPLLSFGCSMTVTNRTHAKAEELVQLVQLSGRLRSMSQQQLSEGLFDLVINATSSGVKGAIPDLPGCL
ncbi:shikimate dehydrogenase, partial [Erwinia amylovora]|nr:shikimate dehydrogenase [Erwinia amylovora]